MSERRKPEKKCGLFVIASRRSAGRVPRMLRSAISAFTRVFDALCGALLIRGPCRTM